MSVVDKLNEAKKYVESKIKIQPRVGLVLGSGLGAFASSVENPIELSFEEIPHFHKTSVVGHKGRLVFGNIRGVPVAVQQGRIHFFEGHSLEQVTFPVRLLCWLGCETIVLTNAAGGLQDGMAPGDLMIIKDHINLTGQNPLIGFNDERLGPRFPDMTNTYSKDLVEKLKHTFKSLNLNPKTGVYGGLTGPTYETPSEIRYLKSLGIDSVGMSTVFEAIVARHMGKKIAGISCISNLGAGLSSEELTHDEVTETTKRVEKVFAAILTQFISEL